MISFESIRSAIVRGLAAYLGNKVIEMNSSGQAPAYPFMTYDFLEDDSPGGLPIIQSQNGAVTLTETVEFTMSFHSYSESTLEGKVLALKARDWFLGEGHLELKYKVDVIVAEIGKVENRDVLVGEEWERRHGFEVTFRTTNRVQYTVETIETANIKGVDPLG
ncbi:phage neck terminator protein [Paenibacillus caseinilyticus]|uniref:phage neck terminator protein n=1 Tax=Paenibacillus caseinilyticus TaxID=3098138 RepID=UPI0022B90A57|nr:hypothetical protein [Paenibacillus caseinilyticus]MCZ8518883.1 hypothetical protein [Paenibacillus caseinilyticus]